MGRESSIPDRSAGRGNHPCCELYQVARLERQNYSKETDVGEFHFAFFQIGLPR